MDYTNKNEQTPPQRSTPKGKKTKDSLGQCTYIGCHSLKITNSKYCETHQKHYYYLDIAERVDVLGDCKSQSKLLQKIKSEQRSASKKELMKEAREAVNGSYTASNLGQCTQMVRSRTNYCYSRCMRQINHMNHTMCPNHLYSSIVKRLKSRRETNIILQGFAADNNISPPSYQKRGETNLEVIPTKCRWTSKEGGPRCGKSCSKFMNTYWCESHIHTSMAINCLIKRDIFLSSEVLPRHLKEITVSWV